MNAWDGDFLGNIDAERQRQAEAMSEADKDFRRCFRGAFLETQDGRKVLMALAGYTRLLATTFTGNSVSYFNEGKRDVMLFILESCGVRSMQAAAYIMQAAVEAEEELKNGRRD